MFSKYITLAFSLLCVLMLATISCSKKDGDSGDDGGDDGNTPYVILDLRVASVSDSSVTLTWTATGDDADQGTASTYDIRFAKSVLTLDNWPNATQVSGEPAPHVAGTAETFEVQGLDEDSTYYFGLQACDEAHNCTNPSFCGPATCFVNSPISFEDAALDSVVRDAVGKATGQLYRSDVINLSFIGANDCGISSLAGLESCPNLYVLFMSQNNVSDLTPLGSIHNLNNLQMSNNNISDISPLISHLNLTVLIIRNNHISDLSALAPMFRIHLVDLRNNDIADLSELVGNLSFADTDTLYVSGNPLTLAATEVQIPILTARGVTVIN